jgi:hypothetical protein
MKVRFIHNDQPCIQYEVLDETPVIEYDDFFGKYVECIELPVLVLVPKKLLIEANHPDNINAIDVSVYLTNK